MISDPAGIGLPVAADGSRRSERRTPLFGASSAFSASLWFSVKMLVQQ